MLARTMLAVCCTIQRAGLAYIAWHTVVLARMLEHRTQGILKTHEEQQA
jgi:hypothetical protein